VPVPAADSAPFPLVELVRAWLDCRKGKRNSASALAFEADLERNLCDLYDELIEGRYKPGRSICFVNLRPKPREVWAAQFRDRIVQHLIYNRIADRFHRSFSADSCACIPGRGTLYGARRLEGHIRSITQNWKRRAFYLKMDVANFFVSIPKAVLWELLAAKVKEPYWRELLRAVLFHDPRQDVEVRGSRARLALVPPHKRLMNAPADTGLPIGNLLSQFCANVFMDVLDQFIKHQLKCRYYIRYVDDFILLHDSPQWLNQARAAIERFVVERLGIRINPSKTILQPISRGVDFVGQVIKPHRRTTRKRTLRAALNRLEFLPAEQLHAIGNSYLGLVRQAGKCHTEQARVGRALRRRGHAVAGDLSKIYRRAK
jgi:RNA-directed DNA polymerase